MISRKKCRCEHPAVQTILMWSAEYQNFDPCHIRSIETFGMMYDDVTFLLYVRKSLVALVILCQVATMSGFPRRAFPFLPVVLFVWFLCSTCGDFHTMFLKFLCKSCFLSYSYNSETLPSQHIILKSVKYFITWNKTAQSPTVRPDLRNLRVQPCRSLQVVSHRELQEHAPQQTGHGSLGLVTACIQNLGILTSPGFVGLPTSVSYSWLIYVNIIMFYWLSPCFWWNPVCWLLCDHVFVLVNYEFPVAAGQIPAIMSNTSFVGFI